MLTHPGRIAGRAPRPRYRTSADFAPKETSSERAGFDLEAVASRAAKANFAAASLPADGDCDGRVCSHVQHEVKSAAFWAKHIGHVHLRPL